MAGWYLRRSILLKRRWNWVDWTWFGNAWNRGKLPRPALADEQQQRARLAILVIVDVALKDFAAANRNLDLLERVLQDSDHPGFAGQWPETLVISESIRHPEMREGALDLVSRVLRQLRDKQITGSAVWERFIGSLNGQLERVTHSPTAETSGQAFREFPVLKNWSSVSRTSAWSRGNGFPCADWHLSLGQVQSLAGHHEDYLYFQMPLRGNFEIECDVSGFGWRDTHLMVAGTWVAPLTNHVSYSLGSFREPPRHSRFHPDRIKNGTGPCAVADSENGTKGGPDNYSENGTKVDVEVLSKNETSGSAIAEVLAEMKASVHRRTWLREPPSQVSEFIRYVISWDCTSAQDIATATSIPKATLSRFLNRQGGLNSEKLNTLAEHLGLSLVRRVRMSDHIDKMMDRRGDRYWSGEVSQRTGDDYDAYYVMRDTAEARQEWEPGFRQELEQKERSRLEAIPWVVIVDETEFHRE